jgi:hypothetical protein
MRAGERLIFLALPPRPAALSHAGHAAAAPEAGAAAHRFRPGACERRPRGFSVEIPHNVEIPHCTETSQPHSMFYFRATKSFHVNRR